MAGDGRTQGRRSPFIVGAPISGPVNDVEKLRAALERKHARYKRPEAPLVLAVLAMSSFMEDRAIASALFGSEAIMMPKSGVGAAKMVRQPDGFWLNRGGAAGDRASAVLIGKGIMHHNCGGTWPQLWHHPLASEALNVDLPFPAVRVIDDALQLTDGRGHPHELLGLTADWPGPIHRSRDEATAGLDRFASYGWPRAGDRESRTVLSLPRRSAAGSRHRTTDALVKMSTMQALRSLHAPGHSPCEGRSHDLRLECDGIDAAAEYVD